VSAETTAWLDQAQQRAAAATVGPWTVMDGPSAPSPDHVWIASPHFAHIDDVEVVTDWTGSDDAAFIAAARTDLPRALAALRAVLAEADACDQLAKSAEDTHGDDRAAAAYRLAARGIRGVIHTALTGDACPRCGAAATPTQSSAPGAGDITHPACSEDCGWEGQP
jgi:hypothetical protein